MRINAKHHHIFLTVSTQDYLQMKFPTAGIDIFLLRLLVHLTVNY